MPDRARLQALLRRLDGRPYPAWRDLAGTWRIGPLTLLVDHVQGDPYAAPSRIRLRVPTDLDPALAGDTDRRVAAEDWLLRRFADGLAGRRRGSGRSGELAVLRPGPEVVERSALRLLRGAVAEVRLAAGLPARGRRILGRQGEALLLEDLPRAAASLRAAPGLDAHVRSVVVQRELRRQLRPRGLVAFVADGSVLPRASGVDRRPLPGAVPFRSPDALRVVLDAPGGPVTGMGIPQGVTVIAGGGFHGKSTLLQALQWGFLDHVPGDGRERVVSDPDTVKVRAEDGRRIAAVDVSAFLRDLPGGRSTAPLSTEDASGSTSQAAAIVEAIEAGARVLLMDEDTCATNLLYADPRMRRLVPRDREPITPLVERVRQLADEAGVSVVLVVGGLVDFLGAADRVIVMDAFRPREATGEAHAIVGTVPPPPGPLPRPAARRVLGLGAGDRPRVRSRDSRRVELGKEEVDLAAVEQVLDPVHAATLGRALRWIDRELGACGPQTLPALLDRLEARLDAEGVEVLGDRPWPDGWLVRPRRHEVAAALNRLRTLQVRAAIE